jgi:hypothetical protein
MRASVAAIVVQLDTEGNQVKYASARREPLVGVGVPERKIARVFRSQDSPRIGTRHSKLDCT